MRKEGKEQKTREWETKRENKEKKEEARTELELNMEDVLLLEINPWKKPIGLILWGLALTTIHWKYQGLWWVLPTIGELFLYLGFRSLRKENGWLHISWLLSLITLLGQTGYLLILATPKAGYILQGHTLLNWMLVAASFVRLICFRQGLREVEDSVSWEESDPVRWLLLWYVLLVLLSFLTSGGWLLLLVLGILFILLLRQLYLTGVSLGDRGYLLEPAHIRIGNRMLSVCYMAGLLLTLIGLSLSYSHIPPKNAVLEANRVSSEQTEAGTEALIQKKLYEMGFPEELFCDLREEEQALLQEAESIQVKTDELLFAPRQVWTKTSEHSYNRSSYEEKRHHLDITMVVVQLPEREVYTLIFFEWKHGNPWWQDAFFFEGSYKTELTGGSLLYERKGNTYRAPIPQLQTGVRQDFAAGKDVITGIVSYPFGSKRQRGYLICHTTIPAGNTSISGILSYYHDNNPLSFPYEDTQEKVLKGDYSGKEENYHLNSFLGCDLDL